jgi:hypothetical protein
MNSLSHNKNIYKEKIISAIFAAALMLTILTAFNCKKTTSPVPAEVLKGYYKNARIICFKMAECLPESSFTGTETLKRDLCNISPFYPIGISSVDPVPPKVYYHKSDYEEYAKCTRVLTETKSCAEFKDKAANDKTCSILCKPIKI